MQDTSAAAALRHGAAHSVELTLRAGAQSVLQFRMFRAKDHDQQMHQNKASYTVNHKRCALARIVSFQFEF